MVGQVPLTHFVQVRILVAQPKVDAWGHSEPRRSFGGCERGESGEGQQARQHRVLWRQQHAAEVGRILDFAETAAMGGNVEVQKREV